MYRSKEVRWFSADEQLPVRNWFTESLSGLATRDTRSDFYLYLPDREDINVKLREGCLEVKHRVSEPYAGKLGKTGMGCFEEWIKWSFRIAEDGDLAKNIVNNHLYVFDLQLPFGKQLTTKSSHWIEIKKERMGVKITADTKGHVRYWHIKDPVENGCQAEYTRIEVLGKTYYTYGFEWFGSGLALNDALYDKILGGTKARRKDSFGYAKFLSELL